jgi:hypothetical protein
MDHAVVDDQIGPLFGKAAESMASLLWIGGAQTTPRFASLTANPSLGAAASCVDEVRVLHELGKERAAADALLGFVDHAITHGDRLALDDLALVLARRLTSGDDQLATESGQARVLNVLAMTNELEFQVVNRPKLRAAFWKHLEKIQGRKYAETLLARL